MATNKYVPKVGDRAHSEEFGDCVVHSVDEGAETAYVRVMDARYEGNAEHRPAVKWTELKKISREDVNQAAARIVREATETD